MTPANLAPGAQHYELIAAVSSIREQITGIVNGKLSSAEFGLIKSALVSFGHFNTIRLFLEDCERSVGGVLDFSATRDYVFEKKEPIVIALFDVPYNTHLGFDAFVYELEAPDAFFFEKYKASMASTINIRSCTQGFDQYPTCVALFPENFRATRPVKNKFSVFYFLNVFVRRFEEYGRPVLSNYVSKRSFWRLKRLSRPELLKAFATWHYLHEYFHSTGHLPLADYFRIKNTKSTAALEELRVDILSILECIENAQKGYGDAYFYAELILFERLLRYSAHLDPEENYDARSSLIFLNFLQEQEAVTIDNEYKLDLQKTTIKQSLSNYVSSISQLEKVIKDSLDAEVASVDYKTERKPLKEFAEKYTGKDEIRRNRYLQQLYSHSLNNAKAI